MKAVKSSPALNTVRSPALLMSYAHAGIANAAHIANVNANNEILFILTPYHLSVAEQFSLWTVPACNPEFVVLFEKLWYFF